MNVSNLPVPLADDTHSQPTTGFHAELRLQCLVAGQRCLFTAGVVRLHPTDAWWGWSGSRGAGQARRPRSQDADRRQRGFV